jgi:hypothetical protein
VIALAIMASSFAQDEDATPVPRPPPVVELGDRWVVLEARVGDVLHTRLVDPAAAYPDRTFESLDAPPTFDLAEDGTILFTPEPADVGRWRIAVRIRGGSRPSWTGILLHVRPREGTIAGATLTTTEVVPDATPAPPGKRGLAQGCFVGLGIEAAGGVGPGSFWQHVGETGVQLAASPRGSVSCMFGEPTGAWIVGLDSAPFVSWPMEEGEGRHALALVTGAQLGTPRWKFGPVLTAGSLLAGAGLRGHWLGLGAAREPPMGLEAQILWLAPVTVSGSIGMVWAL